MAKPFLVPHVSTTKTEGFSLRDLATRLLSGPSMVRVGLPDSKTTEEGEAKREARRKGRTARSGKQP